MIIPRLTAVLAAQPAFGALIARHEGHDENSTTLLNTENMTIPTYSMNAEISYNPTASSQVPASSNITETVAIMPSSSNIRSNGPYNFSNATSTTRCPAYGSGMRGSLSFHACPAPTTHPPTTVPWNDLWPIHWPASRVSNSSAAATSAPVAASNSSVALSSTDPAFAIPILTARPDQSVKLSSTAVEIILITTMRAPTLPQAPVAPTQSIHSTSDNPDFSSVNLNVSTVDNAGTLDPVYPGPTDTQTSTIHITVTLSTAKLTPTMSPLEEPTITSTLVKTVTLPSSTPQSSHNPEPSQTPRPSSALKSSNPDDVHTTILSADPRCPYPFPGVYCGEPKTTLVTETSKESASTTLAPSTMGGSGKPKESGLCPYPGQTC